MQIPDEVLFYLSCCHEIDDSKATGKEESINLCADGVGWNWRNEGNVRPLGGSFPPNGLTFPSFSKFQLSRALLKADYIIFLSLYFLFKKFFNLLYFVGRLSRLC